MRRERTDRTADEAQTEPPLVVDVDGSLIGGDLLIEGIARLLSVSPLSLFALLFWLVAATVSGRAGLKRRIAEAVPLPPDTLALNPAVLEEIATAQAAGRSVWLASASDAHAVSPLAETVGAAGCLASDGRTNLGGQGGRSGRALRRARVRLHRQRAARSGGLEAGAARYRGRSCSGPRAQGAGAGRRGPIPARARRRPARLVPGVAPAPVG